MTLNNSELYDEICGYKKYCVDRKRSIFPIDKKWYIRTFYREQIPCHNVHKIVEFCLSLPGSNAVTERIFVDMNNL
jgi:hypothetical protein